MLGTETFWRWGVSYPPFEGEIWEFMIGRWQCRHSHLSSQPGFLYRVLGIVCIIPKPLLRTPRLLPSLPISLSRKAFSAGLARGKPSGSRGRERPASEDTRRMTSEARVAWEALGGRSRLVFLEAAGFPSLKLKIWGSLRKLGGEYGSLGSGAPGWGRRYPCHGLRAVRAGKPRPLPYAR